MHMTRLWMTGCMALVLLAAGRWLPREAPEETASGERNRPSLSTRHGLNETVSRIEKLARQRGLVVLARAPAQAAGVAAVASRQASRADLNVAAMPSQAPTDARVLVLGDADGRTAAWQPAGQAVPVLPWQVVVRQRPDGGTDVWLPAADALPPVADAAGDALQQIQALPQAVSDALV
jgi:hypothetical protein